MAEEMFNEEQRGHMRYLASLPADAKCACGWRTKEECNHDSNCEAAAKRLADRKDANG